MKKLVFICICNISLLFSAYAQKQVRTFIFGHSLIHHEAQVNPTPSQETSVPHWFHFLSVAAGHEYSMSGQYGFLPQHANLPPIAQWGFDYVEGAWESDTEPFSAAEFTNILVTPGNFVQWQPPGENYYNENISPIDATTSIFDWCLEQEPSLDFFIYENWPDMAPYLNNGFPPTESEWNSYLEFLNGDFHDWFVEYHDSMRMVFSDQCVKMIPVGPVINNLLKMDPFNTIPINELYEDDAPHGRATTYFLASLATYMAMYEEKPPVDFQMDQIIHPIIRDNYTDAVDYIWNTLLKFNDENANSRVFCSNDVVASIGAAKIQEYVISPNPTQGQISIQNLKDELCIEIYNSFGERILLKNNYTANHAYIDLRAFPSGLFVVVVRNKFGEIVSRSKVIKTVSK